MLGFGVGVGGHCSHDGVDNANGGGLFSFDVRVLDTAGFKLTGEVSVQSGVGLSTWRIFRVRKAIQDMGCNNCPTRMRNRLFPKLVQSSIGVVGMSDPVSVYL